MISKLRSMRNPKRTPEKGEIWIWMTSIGLVAGLVMVVFLFGLIAYRGFIHFWPVPVAQIVVDEESEDTFRGNNAFAGVIISTKERNFEFDGDTPTEEELEELQESEHRVFVGNRDFYGQSYRYFLVSNIEEITYPEDIIRAERRIEGDGLFIGEALTLGDGTVVEKEDENFESLLADEVREARKRRAEIQRIDRREIGPINSEIRTIELDLRFLERQSKAPEGLSDGEMKSLETLLARKAELDAEFEILRDEAQALREINQAISLQYRLVDGTEGRIEIGDLYRYYYPNRIGFSERAKVFAIQFWEFVSGYPREANQSGGIFPAIFGTFVMTLIMSIAVTPFGVITAIYLREYARQGPVVRVVRIAVNNLAGVPSIVFGVFGLGFFVYFVGGSIDSVFFAQAKELGVPTFGTGGILWAGLTLALLNLPVVIVATEEAISAVPRGVREGSLACGASKWQTVQRLVIPAALPGILTGMIMAMARGAGEVAPLMLVGVVALAPNLPLDGTFPFLHLERQFMHLGFHIYDVGFQSPDSEAAIPLVFATTFVLIGLIVLLNMGAILLRNHIRKRHKGSAF